jgi:hypothetical protein
VKPLIDVTTDEPGSIEPGRISGLYDHVRRAPLGLDGLAEQILGSLDALDREDS